MLRVSILILALLLIGTVTAQGDIITISERESCELPYWNYATIRVIGESGYHYIYDTEALEPLISISGTDMWLGYDFPGNEAGAATWADPWFWISLRVRGYLPSRAAIRFNQQGGRVFMWYHPNMQTRSGRDGKHFGWHPCAIIEVPFEFIEGWLQNITRE